MEEGSGIALSTPISLLETDNYFSESSSKSFDSRNFGKFQQYLTDSFRGHFLNYGSAKDELFNTAYPKVSLCKEKH